MEAARAAAAMSGKRKSTTEPQAEATPVVSKCPLCDVTRHELEKALAALETASRSMQEMTKEKLLLGQECGVIRRAWQEEKLKTAKFKGTWGEVAEIVGYTRPPHPDESRVYNFGPVKTGPITKEEIVPVLKDLHSREEFLQGVIEELKQQLQPKEQEYKATLSELSRRYLEKPVKSQEQEKHTRK